MREVERMGYFRIPIFPLKLYRIPIWMISNSANFSIC